MTRENICTKLDYGTNVQGVDYMNENEKLKAMLKVMSDDEKNDLYILLKNLTASKERKKCNQELTSSPRQ